MSWRNDPITAPAAAPAGSPAGSPAAPWANDPIVGPTARQTLTTAVTMKADAMAEAERLAKRYPAPPEVILQDLEAYRLQEVVDLADTDLQKAPMLREILRRDVKVAAMAQDDIPTLAKVGKFVGDLGGSAKAGVFRASRGAAGTFQAGFELLAPAFDWLEPVTVVGGNPLRRLAEGFAMQGAAAGQTAAVARPNVDGTLASGFFSGVESLTQNLLTLPMAFAPGGQGAALAGMTGFTGGDAYQQAREKGLPMSQALPFAASQAAIEYATEKLPLANLLKDVKAGAGFLRILGRQVALEVPGEQIATVLQDLNEWAILNPEKPFSSYLEERPSAAAQTLIATIVGTGGNVAVAKGLETMLSRAVSDGANMQQAGLAGQALEQAMQGAEASLLRQRSPDQFRAVMREMSQDGSLYVDAAVLNQMPPEVLAQLPGVAEALQTATADTPVEVKLADALTVLPGTPQAEVFMQNARTSPDAPSLAEAQAAGEQAQTFLQQEAQRVIAQAQDQEAFRASREVVKQTLLEQLNAAGRFRAGVNDVKAGLAADYFAVMGARNGMPPEQFYQRYPLRVLGAPVGQQTGVLNAQGDQTQTPEFRNWFGDSKVVDEQGRPLVVYHGTTGDFSIFARVDGGNAYGPGYYFTADPAEASGYAEGTGGGRIRPSGDAAPNVMPVYLSAQNVYNLDGRVLTKAEITKLEAASNTLTPGAWMKGELVKAFDRAYQPTAQNVMQYIAQQVGGTYTELAQAAGYDGLRGRFGHVVFKPEQIKSAIGNRGTFDPNDPNILRQSGFAELRPESRDLLGRLATVARDTLAGETRNDAVSAQSLVDSSPGRSESVADLGVGQPGSPQEQGLGDRPALIAVLSEMRRAALEDLQVLGAIVGAVPVDMVNNLAGSQRAAEDLLRNHPVFQDGPAVDAELAVAQSIDATDPGSLLLREVALRAAEVGRRSLDAGLEPKEYLAARGAVQGDGLRQVESFQQGPRATFNPRTLEIVLNQNTDLSSFFHELGHFFLEVQADIASQPGAPAQIVEDMDKILKWFGVEDLATWRAMALDQQRPYHERLAESFEQYMLEGKAPSVELQPVFRRIRAWFVQAYKSIKSFVAGKPELQLNDDIRRVFDRMLATDEQIAQANEVAGLVPDEQADGEAAERLQKRSMRDLALSVKARDAKIKALRKEAKAWEKTIREEVTAEVDATPEMRAKAKLDELRKAKQLDDATTAAVADSFGYESVDAMLRAIDAFGKRADAIDGMTEQRMLEEHGELIDERAIQEAANEAVHNDARARSLATELRTQAEMLNAREDTGRVNAKGSKITVNALVEAAKQFGANVIARTPLKDLKATAWKHTAAERRAGKRWTEATAAGKTEEAVQAKRDQMLNNAAAKAALDAATEAKKILEFFARVAKGNDEKVVEKGRDADIVNAARAVLAAYGIETPTTKRASEYLDAVKVNDPETYAALEPMITAATQNAQPLQALTFEELQGLAESVRAMWFLAKASRQMEVDGDRVDLDEVEDELYARAEEIGIPDRIPGEGTAVTAKESRIRKLRELRLNLTRVEQWAEAMDGKAQGPFWRFIFLPIKAAADRVRARRIDVFRTLEAATKAVAPAISVGKIEAPEIGYVFGEGAEHNGVGMAELLPALLNVGNESNKRKLLLGRGWATETNGVLDTSQWDAFINRLHSTGILTKAHWDYVQTWWDVLESLKPAAQAAHRQVYGRYFSEVTAEPVQTPFGTYRGGYYPAQTDTELVTDMAIKKLAEAENENMSYSFPSVNKGFTKSRVEAYTRPLKLDMNVGFQHVDKVILFSEMQPAAQGVGRLLRRKKVSQPLERIAPGVFEALLVPWSNDASKQIVERPVMGDGGFNRGASILRSRVGMQLMMGNLLNTVQQVSGIPAVAAKIEADGLKRSFLRKSLVKWVAHPKSFSENVWEQSAYMKDRSENEVAAMSDTMRDILFNPTLLQRGEAWTRRHAYFLQTWMDNRIAPIAWQAGYDAWRASQPRVDTTGISPDQVAALEARQHRDAVLYADSLVRQTQGSQLPEDVSRFERGIGFVRLFSQFAGYFNMQANTNAASVVKLAEQGGLKKNSGRGFYVLMMGLLAPIWIAEAIALALRGGPDDEDKDGAVWDDWLRSVFGMGTFRGMVAMVPVFGQAATAAVNRFNSNPADDKMSISPAVSFFESLGSAGYQIVRGATGEDVNAQRLVRDMAMAAGTATGLPLVMLARPVGYAAGVAQGKIEPTGPVDAARGLVTGTASPESKVR